MVVVVVCGGDGNAGGAVHLAWRSPAEGGDSEIEYGGWWLTGYCSLSGKTGSSQINRRPSSSHHLPPSIGSARPDHPLSHHPRTLGSSSGMTPVNIRVTQHWGESNGLFRYHVPVRNIGSRSSRLRRLGMVSVDPLGPGSNAVVVGLLAVRESVVFLIDGPVGWMPPSDISHHQLSEGSAGSESCKRKCR
ncbi:hypothetical protein Tco_0873039 [Tanacetum coccineum]